MCHISMENLPGKKLEAEFNRDFELLNEQLGDPGCQGEWLETCKQYTFHSQFSANWSLWKIIVIIGDVVNMVMCPVCLMDHKWSFVGAGKSEK